MPHKVGKFRKELETKISEFDALHDQRLTKSLCDYIKNLSLDCELAIYFAIWYFERYGEPLTEEPLKTKLNKFFTKLDLNLQFKSLLGSNQIKQNTATQQLSTVD
jgi:hypothetical protein